MGVVNASLKDTTQIYLSFHYIIPTQSTDHNGDGIIYTGQCKINDAIISVTVSHCTCKQTVIYEWIGNDVAISQDAREPHFPSKRNLL